MTSDHPLYDGYLAAAFELEVLETFDYFGLVSKDADPLGYDLCSSFFCENMQILAEEFA